MRGTLIFIVFNTLSVLSILFIDKPFALWIHKVGLDNLLFLRYVTETPQYWLSITYIAILLVFPSCQLCSQQSNIRDFKTRNFIFDVIKILYFTSVVLIALWIKTKLKIFFGRDWPLHWSGAPRGLIPEGIYQFNILQSTSWKGSFPSGHTTLAATTGFIMYLLYPRAKYLWLILSLILILSILILDYHFLGDCLAGIALGGICAYYGALLYCCASKMILRQ